MMMYPEYYSLGGLAGANVLNVISDWALLFGFSGTRLLTDIGP